MEESLADVNDKICETKKRIQLSEGQRKAHFEECDAEKKRNAEKIGALKKEVKEMYATLGEPFHCRESTLRTSGRYPKDVGALRGKKVEEAVVFMDLKCIDLNKRLDVIKYRNKTKKIRLKRLAEEYRNVIIRANHKKVQKTELVGSKVLLDQRTPVCILENRIHRVEMNMMEAEHVNKKYKTIRLQLISDSVAFESSLKKLEEEMGKQEEEIKSLEAINREAVGLRNLTKGTLLRQEMCALNAGKARECELQDFRHRVEERKVELEKLERRIFPTGRVVFEEGGEATAVAQGDDATDRVVAQLESHFAKLKVATGETETEEVLPRFLSQKETKQRLDFLKRITEEEKRELEMRKELSLAELEAFKFAEVKDKEESQEEIEKVNLAIESEEKLKERHEKEVERIMAQLVSIRRCLYSLIEQLQGMNEEVPPDDSADVGGHPDILDCLARKIQSGLAKVAAGETLRESLKNLDRTQCGHLISDVSIQIPGEEPAIFPGFLPQDEAKYAKAQQPSLLATEQEDEDDVLSRAYLKRQAQLIVDAKSRKKFNRVFTFPKAKK